MGAHVGLRDRSGEGDAPGGHDEGQGGPGSCSFGGDEGAGGAQSDGVPLKCPTEYATLAFCLPQFLSSSHVLPTTGKSPGKAWGSEWVFRLHCIIKKPVKACCVGTQFLKSADLARCRGV